MRDFARDFAKALSGRGTVEVVGATDAAGRKQATAAVRLLFQGEGGGTDKAEFTLGCVRGLMGRCYGWVGAIG